MSVFVASGTASSGGPECATAGGVNEVEVWSASDAQGLLDLLAYYRGGAIDVTWHGRVSVNDTFYVLDGTFLTVTGVHDASSSSTSIGSGDENVADDSTAGAAVIDGGYNTSFGVFCVHNGSTLSLDNMVLEKGHSVQGGAALSAGVEVFDAASPWVPENTVNVNYCIFQDNIDDGHDGGEMLKKEDEASSVVPERHELLWNLR